LNRNLSFAALSALIFVSVPGTAAVAQRPSWYEDQRDHSHDHHGHDHHGHEGDKHSRSRNDQRLTDQRLTDQRLTDQRLTDQRLTDQRLTDQRLTDQRPTDQRPIQRTPNNITAVPAPLGGPPPLSTPPPVAATRRDEVPVLGQYSRSAADVRPTLRSPQYDDHCEGCSSENRRERHVEPDALGVNQMQRSYAYESQRCPFEAERRNLSSAYEDAVYNRQQTDRFAGNRNHATTSYGLGDHGSHGYYHYQNGGRSGAASCYGH
jgi:hypothetical protein